MAGPDTNTFFHPRPFRDTGHQQQPPPQRQSQPCFFSAPAAGALSRRDSLPLVVEMPTGRKKQLTVPVTASVDDLLAALNADSGDLVTADNLLSASNPTTDQQSTGDDQAPLSKMLSFNGVPMSRGRPIADYNIPAAYEGAASMLWTIGEAGLDLEDAASAINSTAQVANHISMGVNDVDDLVQAALGDQSKEEANAETPDTQDNDPDPADLLRKLSVKAPHIFQAQAVENVSRKYQDNTAVNPVTGTGPGAGPGPGATKHPSADEIVTSKAGSSTWLEELTSKYEILGDQESARKRPVAGDSSSAAPNRKVKRKTVAATYQERLDSMQRDNEELEAKVKDMREAVERLQQVLTVRVLSSSDKD